jgi:hypothetical protein
MDGPAHGGASVRDRAGSPSSQLRSAFTRTALPVVDPLASGMHTSGLFMTLYYPLLCLWLRKCWAPIRTRLVPGLRDWLFHLCQCVNYARDHGAVVFRHGDSSVVIGCCPGSGGSSDVGSAASRATEHRARRAGRVAWLRPARAGPAGPGPDRPARGTRPVRRAARPVGLRQVDSPAPCRSPGDAESRGCWRTGCPSPARIRREFWGSKTRRCSRGEPCGAMSRWAGKHAACWRQSAPAWMTPSLWCGCRNSPTPIRTNCRAARLSAPLWRAPWLATRICCCWTSRLVGSIP